MCLLSVALVVGGGVVRAQESLQAIVEEAEQGDAEMQALLGSMYAEGVGVTQSYVTAREWYEKVAEQGNSEAQYSKVNVVIYGLYPFVYEGYRALKRFKSI